MPAAPAPPTADATAASPRAWFVVWATALTYAATGWLALQLALASGWASPMYPAAGLAVAAVTVFGWPAALGTGLGSLAVNLGLAIDRGTGGLEYLFPLVSGTGAALQALLAARLWRRAAAGEPWLRSPRDVLRFVAWAALLPCLLNASLSTPALWLAGSLPLGDLAFTWWTWWAGDALGVLIGAPIALTLIGRPRDEWAPRRLTVGVPMLLGTLTLVLATVFFHRWEQQRLEEIFRGAADAMSEAVREQLDEAVYALQAVHGVYAHQPDARRVPLADLAGWWQGHAPSLRAIGYSQRVAREAVPAFEAEARASGLTGYRVFERADSAGLARDDSHVLAMRAIEPPAGNASALGVNVMSIPAARQAVLQAARTGEVAATEGFVLTQAQRPGDIGIVLYRALYDGRAATADERLARWRAVVFVTLEPDQAVSAVAGRLQTPLAWCLVDPDPRAAVRRLAGPAGCERATASGFQARQAVDLGGRLLELQLAARAQDLPGGQHTGSWLFSLVGLAATALLGMLLLTVTGRARRIEIAVDERTQALSAEVRVRRLAEDALRDSEQRLRSILDHIPNGVVFMDVAGRVLDANPAMLRMLGLQPQALEGLNAADLYHPDEREEHRRAAAPLLAGAVTAVEREMRLLRSDGQYLMVRASLSALPEADGQTRRLVGVVQDISEHLRLAETERARDAAEAASRAKSEFVSRMSHELRTPLNAMLGFAQLLGIDRRPPLALHQAAWATQIQQAGWHLLDMINDTLDLSRIEAGLVPLREQVLDLGPLLGACTALLDSAAARRRIRIELALSQPVPSVTADETRLKQVLTNLLSNAIKYNRDDGWVRVQARVAADGMVEIEVLDGGLGMSAQQMRGLFQPYNRLGRENGPIEGTGIGLVISRRLAELMGGTLTARSEEGRGSAFVLRLPAARFTDSGTLVEPAVPAPTARYQRRVVHYIEDNETNVEIMRGILAQRPQVELETSGNGLDGLAAVRTRRPDLILLDMHLPDIDGLELLRHLKNDDAVASIPVLVLSADATPQRIEEALTLGAAHYLTKPVDVAGFVRVMDEVLSGLDSRWG